jgi:hypothetical protein
MAQLITITSEALQATIRRLLPSQQGFGEDLNATNVITPIIDLTPTAEGSVLREDLQTAANFGQANSFAVTNATSSLVATPGFYKIQGNVVMNVNTTGFVRAQLAVDDTLTTKVVWQMTAEPGTNGPTSVNFVETVFLRAGDTLKGIATANCNLAGHFRQVATVNGEIVQPTGFTFE